MQTDPPKLTLVTNPVVEAADWDRFVSAVYGRRYRLQQQDGCRPKGVERITVPEPDYDDNDAHDQVPEIVNHEKRGVRLDKWLERDPKQPLSRGGVERTEQWAIDIWWDRNFYPELAAVANDLHAKGLLPAGEYTIIIDW